MENRGEMRTDQQPKTPSAFSIPAYPGPSSNFPPGLDTSSACSNSQFQNIPPFGSLFQPQFSGVPTTQNQLFSGQNIPQFPQFDGLNLLTPFSQNSLLNSPCNSATNFSQSSTPFTSGAPFNVSANVPQFDPCQSANNFSFGSCSRGDDNLVQFPFSDGGFGFKSKQIRGKRRPELAELENILPPPKQHITEEKMAEHLSRLHISSAKASSTIEPDSVKNKRLYMCEEMRKLQTDPILPPWLLRQKPCTALVLWQPPSKVLSIPSGSGLGNNKNNNNNDDDNSENNNQNRMVDGLNEVEFEPSVINNMEMDV